MPERPLTPDEMHSLLRECVTVVKPGEILVLRCGPEYTPNHLRDIQEVANEMARFGDWPCVMVVPGDELGVVEAGDA